MTAYKTPTQHKPADTRPGVMVTFPDHLQPKLTIPYEIAQQWMLYGRIGYEDHNSEWGCIVKIHREDNDIFVADWKALKVDASGGYWESIEGETQKHMQDLIDEGREDELSEWNGLFHTHPIGSGASMSATDMQQLKDLAAGGWWGVSIICPANREGLVHDNKFMYHVADDRGDGMFVVSNLKPKIEKPQFDTLELVRDHMKDLMVKRPRTAGSPIRSTYQTGRVLDREKREWVDEIEEQYTGFRESAQAGDWVYVRSLDADSIIVDGMSDEEINDIAELPGKIAKVLSVKSDGQIHAEFFGSARGMWYLNPRVHDLQDNDDDIHILFRKDEVDAKALNRMIEYGLDPINSFYAKSKIDKIEDRELAKGNS